MKKIVFIISCLIVCTTFISCVDDDKYEKYEYPICVVIKTADQNLEYDLFYPVNNKTENTKKRWSLQGTDAIKFRYVKDMGYVNGRINNFFITLHTQTPPKDKVEVCVYDYKSRLNIGDLKMCDLHAIIKDEKAGREASISSDSVFTVLRKNHWVHLYTLDSTNYSFLRIKLDGNWTPVIKQ